MALTFSGSDSQNLIYSGADVAAYPCTISCWVYPTAFSVSAYIAGFGRDSSTIPLMYLFVGTDGKLHAQYRNDASSILTTDASTALSTNTWYHLAVTFGSGGTDQTQYINGSQNGTSGQPPSGAITLDRTGISKRIGVNSTYFTGRIAEVAIWNVKLTANEISTLGQGFSPLFVRPGSLKNYVPMQTYHASNQVDWIGGRAFAVTGTSYADHSRVFMPKRPRLLVPAGTTHELTSSVGSSTTVGSQPTVDAPLDLTAFQGLEATIGGLLTLELDTGMTVGIASEAGYEPTMSVDGGLIVVSIDQGVEAEASGQPTADTVVEPQLGSTRLDLETFGLTESIIVDPGLTSGQSNTVGLEVTLTIAAVHTINYDVGSVSTVGLDIHFEEVVPGPAKLVASQAGGLGGSLRLPRRGNDPEYWPRVPKAPYESPPEEVIIDDLPEFQFLDLDPLVEELNWRLEAERERQLEFIALFEEYKNDRRH